MKFNLNVISFRIKVLGELPDISLDISDYKINELMKLFTSIPFPEGKKQTQQEVNYGKVSDDL